MNFETNIVINLYDLNQHQIDCYLNFIIKPKACKKVFFLFLTL